MPIQVWSIAAVLAFAAGNASAEGASRPLSLYTDKRAHRVEDVITVIVIENARATNDSKTETDEKQSTTLSTSGSGPILSYIPGLGVNASSGQEYDGRGKTSRTGEVKATISARVTAVYDNGNLLVEGHKEVEVNDEKEILKVSGIVRPEDVASDNTVFSFKLADARIQYTGKGDNQNASRPGWWSRFWHWIF
jgi:flagellar L-ring protein precursor FlgH